MKYFLNKIFNLISSGTWFGLYIKHFKKITLISTILIFLVVILLSVYSAHKLREVIVDDFNKQQLAFARYVASRIESSLTSIKRELTLLSLSPTFQQVKLDYMASRMNIAYSSINEIGGLEIRFIQSEPSNKTFIMNKDGFKVSHSVPMDKIFLNYASNKENKGKIFFSNIEPILYNDKERLIMNMILPVWHKYSENMHSILSEKFIGAIVFVIDTTYLIRNLTKGVEMLKDSYIWVINNKGMFLSHPEADFIGKDAFAVRGEKSPKISFTRINEIQKEKMLKGETGTSWYFSGWHKGEVGQIKKLIAYSPVQLDDQDKQLIWSVAIASPIAEVESIIDKVQIVQFVLEGFVLLVILVCGSFLMALMMQWSQSLQNEIDVKTSELKISQHLYKSLIENANDIIFTVTRSGLINSINQAGFIFFKASVDELINQNISKFCSDEKSRFLLLKTIEEVFDTGESKKITYTVEVEGGEYWLNTNFSMLVDINNNPYVLGISRDISAEKKKEKEEQMYQTEKLASLGTLAAGVAHEINNPLTIILGFSDLLLEQTSPDSSEYTMLKTIEKHALNAKKVVEGLLSFARYPEQKEDICDINKNLEDILLVVKNTLGLYNIKLVKEFQEKLPSVKGDPSKLQQVFLNIINNAIHAMKEDGGTLSIKTTLLDNDFVEIRFCDTGHGIKRQYRNRIFEPLFTTKKVGEGTGLGLSVSYGIITQMGGNITFETKTKKETRKPGTTFIITLPAAKQ